MRAALITSLLFIYYTCTFANYSTRTKFGSLPLDVEVHAVAISEPLFCGVAEEEIVDWQGLVKALRAKDGPGAHIHKRLPEGAGRIVNERAEMGKLDDVEGSGVAFVARLRLARELQPAMWATTFYDKDAFAGVELSKVAKELIALGDKRTVYQNELLNRELLAVAFPKCITPTPADFHIARVTVKAGKPVVLVLSCTFQCRWEVKVEKGATVAGVVLFGSMAQELKGVDAPVIYAAKQLPNGQLVQSPGAHATKQEGKSYELMRNAVKEMTGRDFTAFQALR